MSTSSSQSQRKPIKGTYAPKDKDFGPPKTAALQKLKLQMKQILPTNPQNPPF